MAGAGRLALALAALAVSLAVTPAHAGEAACPAGMLGVARPDGRLCVARFETTVQAYARCVKAGACLPRQRAADCNRDTVPRARHPANCVTWQQATRYCAWRGARLPSSAEWQAAAANAMPTLDRRPGADPPADVCWRSGGRGGTCAVGSYCRPGVICDLAGNVAEWTASTRPRPDGHADALVHGGGWRFDAASFAAELDPAFRRPLDPRTSSPEIGFRCVAAPALR